MDDDDEDNNDDDDDDDDGSDGVAVVVTVAEEIACSVSILEASRLLSDVMSCSMPDRSSIVEIFWLLCAICEEPEYFLFIVHSASGRSRWKLS